MRESGLTAASLSPTPDGHRASDATYDEDNSLKLVKFLATRLCKSPALLSSGYSGSPRQPTPPAL
jgi:hypothetical protein